MVDASLRTGAGAASGSHSLGGTEISETAAYSTSMSVETQKLDIPRGADMW